MKRLLTIGILLMPFFIPAQDFTIKSSVAMSKWTGDGVFIKHDYRTGYSFGIYYGTLLTNNLILNVGSRYISNGTIQKFSESLDLMDIRYTEMFVVKSSNLHFPVLLQYMLNERLYLMAGPYASFLLSKEGRFTYSECIDGFCTGEEIESDLDHVLESNSFGVEFGIGVIAFNGLLLELSQINGLSSIIDMKDPVRNQSLMLTLGYKF